MALTAAGSSVPLSGLVDGTVDPKLPTRPLGALHEPSLTGAMREEAKTEIEAGQKTISSLRDVKANLEALVAKANADKAAGDQKMSMMEAALAVSKAEQTARGRHLKALALDDHIEDWLADLHCLEDLNQAATHPARPHTPWGHTPQRRRAGRMRRVEELR